MKLKELPLSLKTAWRLRRTPIEKLGFDAAPAPSGLVISLTSIESRLARLDLTIRSLLAQDMAATKVMLWLHHSLKAKLPAKLLALVGQRFEIHYSNETCSHRKLVETLRLNFEQTVVTCDDDVMYPTDWLRRLVDAHIAFPNCIVAHECREINYDEQGKLQPYSQWNSAAPNSSKANTLAIGYGGVLYPPKALPVQVLDRAEYDRLAPRADDLWFKAMSLLNGTQVRRTENCRPKPVPVIASQGVSLKKHNVREDGNFIQWQALDNHFNLKANIVGGNNGDRVK
ncbi:glycosyltransferase family 2 protein [Saccharophagus degradans]|uniref:glycosyltransferase family 2 protein n=1 Tax=Saccharophagus degradans TaxID=86304 RepID=UPI001C08AB2A|nr:glycosyltransferase family 2 protein [Saccharophagus degradans]